MPPRAPDPHNLHGMARQAAFIQANRACLGCGSNLKGLPIDTKCPECGLPSTLPESIDDPLALMPLKVIAALVRGLWVASICVAAVIAIVVLDPWQLWERWISLAALTTAAVLWTGAAFWLTPAFTLPQAVFRGFSVGSRVRTIARWPQIGWAFAAGAMLLEDRLPNAPAALAMLLDIVQVAGVLSGLMAFISLCLLLESLADWTRDHSAIRLFNWAMWGVPIAALLMLAGFPRAALSRLDIVIWAVMILLLSTFPYALLSLSSSVTLSILHALEHRDREHRKEQRRRKHEERLVQTVRAMDREKA